MALSRRDRLWLAAAGIGLLGLLGVAAMLEPARSGHGTHEQLGLPPCMFGRSFARPCPACGMTTSWACSVRGRWPSALRANVGGTLLALVAVVAAPWLLASAWRGAWIGVVPNSTAVAWIATLVFVVVLIDWAVRFVRGP